jgi:hypothetical protein
MLSIEIHNPLVENYLCDTFQNNTKQISLFVNDFIEKELIKKDISMAFTELEEMLTENEKQNTLQDLIKEITPE